MLLKEVYILTAHEDLSHRDKIYKAWLSSLEGQVVLSDYAGFYYYLKKNLGICLTPLAEKMLVSESAIMSPRDLLPGEINKAEASGLFDAIHPDFAKWQAVIWARLCCAALFASFGTNSNELLEQLGLHLIRGSRKANMTPGEVAEIHGLAIEGKGLQEIAKSTGKSNAFIFACLWEMKA